MKAADPFITPPPHLATDQPAYSDLYGTDRTSPQRQVTSKSPQDSDLLGTDHTVPGRQSTSKLSRDRPYRFV